MGHSVEIYEMQEQIEGLEKRIEKLEREMHWMTSEWQNMKEKKG